MNSASAQRFVALDLHKHYVMVGAVNADQEVVLHPRRVSIAGFPDWAEQHLQPGDQVVIEATTNAWPIYDRVAPLVARTVVAHPPEVKKIVNARVKTDRRAVLDLAGLLAARLIPEVWVPPLEVRELRSPMAHRRRLTRMSTMARNRLQSVVHGHNLTPPPGQLLSQQNRSWWQAQELSSSQRLRVEQDLATLEHLQTQLKAVDGELLGLSNSQPWASPALFLMQVPGFGLITTMTVLAAIGDVRRFPSARQLVGYSGLGASVHASGKKHRQGRITKRGRRELRWALVEAARAAVRSDAYWKAQYQRLARRQHHHQAIVAVARRLLVTAWHLLTKQEAYRLSSADQIAYKLVIWSARLGRAYRQGLTSAQFVRYGLLRLDIGHELTGIVRSGHRHRIADVAEVLALYPELRPPD
jgi:transposase